MTFAKVLSHAQKEKFSCYAACSQISVLLFLIEYKLSMLFNRGNAGVNNMPRLAKLPSMPVDPDDIILKPYLLQRQVRDEVVLRTPEAVTKISKMKDGAELNLWFVSYYQNSNYKFLNGVNELLRRYKIRHVYLDQYITAELLKLITQSVLNGLDIDSIEFSLKPEYGSVDNLNNILKNVKRITQLSLYNINNLLKVAKLLKKIKKINILNIVNVVKQTPTLLLSLKRNQLEQLTISLQDIRKLFLTGKVIKFLNLKKAHIRHVTTISKDFVKFFSVLVDELSREVSCILKAPLNMLVRDVNGVGDRILVLILMCKKLKYLGSNVPSTYTSIHAKNILGALEKRRLIVSPSIKDVLTNLNQAEEVLKLNRNIFMDK